MIYDSATWKNELKSQLASIRDFFESTDLNVDEEFESREGEGIEEREMLDVAYINLQRFAIFSSIIIRKMIEARKISGEVLGSSISITTYPKATAEEVTISNGYEVERLYDLLSPKKTNIAIGKLTDLLIHSYHFMPHYEWAKVDEEESDDDPKNWEVVRITGFYFTSDKTKEDELSFIDFEAYCSAIEKVIADFIVSVQYENGKIVKTSSRIPTK